MQAAFQASVDNAVSKTVNLPQHATPGEVRDIFLRAWRLRLKGVTVFRTGSGRPEVIESGFGDGCGATP
jgi:ribonucleoside-diphosphate reductase alpha chain